MGLSMSSIEWIPLGQGGHSWKAVKHFPSGRYLQATIYVWCDRYAIRFGVRRPKYSAPIRTLNEAAELVKSWVSSK